MATKGKNKNSLRRKVRAATKRVDRDIGAHGNARFIHSGYNSGVRARDFPKRDTSADTIDNNSEYHYDVEYSNMLDEEDRAAMRREEQIANHIDGYDRDDLGESQDY